jgi:hypothetical protein
VRLDGALTSAPEQGEGGTTNVYYQPSVEIVQEFKVENNSFSAEYGHNGGTVVNMVLKSGTNNFHGSGWWYGQRSALDANDWFNNAQNIPKPDHIRDRFGFSLGGPIKKQKTFFFIDLELTRQHDPVNMNGTVPTAAASWHVAAPRDGWESAARLRVPGVTFGNQLSPGGGKRVEWGRQSFRLQWCLLGRSWRSGSWECAALFLRSAGRQHSQCGPIVPEGIQDS